MRLAPRLVLLLRGHVRAAFTTGTQVVGMLVKRQDVACMPRYHRGEGGFVFTETRHQLGKTLDLGHLKSSCERAFQACDYALVAVGNPDVSGA